MRKLLLAAVALGGLTAMSATGAMAQPYAQPYEGRSHAQAERPMVHQSNYDHSRHHYNHRRWEHHRWHYWD